MESRGYQGVTTDGLIAMLRAHLMRRGIVLGAVSTHRRISGAAETLELRNLAEFFMDALAIPHPVDSETTDPIAIEVLDHARALSRLPEPKPPDSVRSRPRTTPPRPPPGKKQ